MNPVIQGYIGALWQWVVDAWDTGNWWVRVALIMLVGFPIAQLALVFLMGVTMSMAAIALAVLAIIAYVLIWRFRYPAIYPIIGMLVKDFWKKFFFILAADSALAIFISLVGMMISLRDHEPVSDGVLLRLIVLAALVLMLLARVIEVDTKVAAKKLWGWMSFVIGLGLFLLIFTPVRGAIGERITSSGIWMAEVISGKSSDTTSVKPPLSADLGSGYVGTAPPQAFEGNTGATLTGAAGDTVSAPFTVSRGGRVRIQATTPMVLLWEDTTGHVEGIKCGLGEAIWVPGEDPAAKDVQAIRIVLREAGSVTVGKL